MLDVFTKDAYFDFYCDNSHQFILKFKLVGIVTVHIDIFTIACRETNAWLLL